MNRPHFSIKKNKETAIDKVKSPLTKYCVTFTSCLLICITGFIFLVFKTDNLIKVNDATLRVKEAGDTITVSSVTRSLEDDINPNIPGVTAQTGEWYSTVPDTFKLAGNKVEDYPLSSQKSVPLYDGLPWNASDTTYRFDVVQAAIDVVEFIDTKAGKPSNIDISSHIVREYTYGEYSMEVDGIQAIAFAPPPSVYMKDYCDGFKSNFWSTAQNIPTDLVGGHPRAINKYIRSETPRKYCVELTDDSGKCYYMPLTATDTKGHTFPGGVMQTHCKLISDMSTPEGPMSLRVGDHGPDLDLTWSAFVDGLDTIDPANDGESAKLRAYMHVNLEINGLRNEECKPLNSRFKVTAFYAW